MRIDLRDTNLILASVKVFIINSLHRNKIKWPHNECIVLHLHSSLRIFYYILLIRIAWVD